MIDRHKKNLTVVNIFMNNHPYYELFVTNNIISKNITRYEFLVVI